MQTACVVGAGCSGLQAAHVLRQAGFRVRVLEQKDDIGGHWASTGLNTTVPWKQIQLVGLPWHEVVPAHLLPASTTASPAQVLTYLHGYATHCNLWDIVQLQCEVIKATQVSDKWVITYSDSASGVCSITTDYLIICTGKSGKQHVPPIKGQDRFAHVQCHASDLSRHIRDARGASVLIYGDGQEAADSVQQLLIPSAPRSLTLLFGQAHWLTLPDSTARRKLLSRAAPRMSPHPYYTKEHKGRGLGSKLKEAFAGPQKKEFWKGIEAQLKAHSPNSTLPMPKENLLDNLLSSSDSADSVVVDDVSTMLMSSGHHQAINGKLEELGPASALLSDGRELPITLLVYATGAASFPYSFFGPEVQQRLLQPLSGSPPREDGQKSERRIQQQVECTRGPGSNAEEGLWLYRHVLPLGVPGLAFVGCEATTPNSVLTAGLQACWLTSVLLKGPSALPKPDSMAQDIAARAKHARSMQRRRGAARALGVLFTHPYYDQLLEDMDIKPHAAGGKTKHLKDDSQLSRHPDLDSAFSHVKRLAAERKLLVSSSSAERSNTPIAPSASAPPDNRRCSQIAQEEEQATLQCSGNSRFSSMCASQSGLNDVVVPSVGPVADLPSKEPSVHSLLGVQSPQSPRSTNQEAGQGLGGSLASFENASGCKESMPSMHASAACASIEGMIAAATEGVPPEMKETLAVWHPPSRLPSSVHWGPPLSSFSDMLQGSARTSLPDTPAHGPAPTDISSTSQAAGSPHAPLHRRLMSNFTQSSKSAAGRSLHSSGTASSVQQQLQEVHSEASSPSAALQQQDPDQQAFGARSVQLAGAQQQQQQQAQKQERVKELWSVLPSSNHTSTQALEQVQQGPRGTPMGLNPRRSRPSSTFKVRPSATFHVPHRHGASSSHITDRSRHGRPTSQLSRRLASSSSSIGFASEGGAALNSSQSKYERASGSLLASMPSGEGVGGSSSNSRFSVGSPTMATGTSGAQAPVTQLQRSSVESSASGAGMKGHRKSMDTPSVLRSLDTIASNASVSLNPADDSAKAPQSAVVNQARSGANLLLRGQTARQEPENPLASALVRQQQASAQLEHKEQEAGEKLDKFNRTSVPESLARAPSNTTLGSEGAHTPQGSQLGLPSTSKAEKNETSTAAPELSPPPHNGHHHQRDLHSTSFEFKRLPARKSSSKSGLSSFLQQALKGRDSGSCPLPTVTSMPLTVGPSRNSLPGDPGSKGANSAEHATLIVTPNKEDSSKGGSLDRQHSAASSSLRGSGSGSLGGGGGSQGQLQASNWSGWRRGCPSSMAQSQAKQDWLVQQAAARIKTCRAEQHGAGGRSQHRSVHVSPTAPLPSARALAPQPPSVATLCEGTAAPAVGGFTPQGSLGLAVAAGAAADAPPTAAAHRATAVQQPVPESTPYDEGHG